MTTMLMPLLSALLLLLLSAAPVPSNAESIVDLLPEQSRDLERVPCGHTRVYHVHALDPTRIYDLKISYPATLPTEFTIDVLRVFTPPMHAGQSESEEGTRHRRSQRELLNTAKRRLVPRELLEGRGLAGHTYRLDESTAAATTTGEPFIVEIAVRPEVEGVSPVHDLRRRECVYNIVVEEMLWGAFPHDTLVLIAWLVFLLLVAWRLVVPWALRLVRLELPEDQRLTRELERAKKT